MKIYTDSENRISRTGVKHEIPDDHPLAKMSETKRLCYVYDGESFYPYVSTDMIEKLEEQESCNLDIEMAVAELAEASAADKLEMEMAMAELAEIIMGGE